MSAPPGQKLTLWPWSLARTLGPFICASHATLPPLLLPSPPPISPEPQIESLNLENELSEIAVFSKIPAVRASPLSQHAMATREFFDTIADVGSDEEDDEDFDDEGGQVRPKKTNGANGIDDSSEEEDEDDPDAMDLD